MQGDHIPDVVLPVLSDTAALDGYCEDAVRSRRLAVHKCLAGASMSLACAADSTQ